MKYFVTGASGFIGSRLIKELISNGHQVVGLARSQMSADLISSTGGEVIHGDLENHDALKHGASITDGVAHLGFIHNFGGDFAKACRIDKEAILAMASVMKGTDKPLIASRGTLHLRNDCVAVENDEQPKEGMSGLRGSGGDALLKLIPHGVAGMVLRLAVTVHGQGDGAFIPIMIAAAQKNRASAYIGDGQNVWPAVHRNDAAVLIRLALESPVPGLILHGVAEEGVKMKDIATAIGLQLNVPIVSISEGEKATSHFGFLGGLVPVHNPVPSAATRKTFGWSPKEIILLQDLAQTYYYASEAAPKF